MTIRCRVSAPLTGPTARPRSMWEQGEVNSPGDIVGAKWTWGLDVREDKFYPGTAMVSVRPASPDFVPGGGSWVDYTNRDFELYYDFGGGDEQPLFKGRVRSVSWMSPSGREADIIVSWDLTDMLGVFAQRALPTNLPSPSRIYNFRTQGFPNDRAPLPTDGYAELCRTRFTRIMSALSVPHNQQRIRSVRRRCAPDLPGYTANNPNLRNYLNILADTEGGHIYVDHTFPKVPTIPETIYFRGSGNAPPEVDLVFSTDPESVDEVPVRNVSAGLDTSELVNVVTFVNHDGQPCGPSVVNEASVASHGVRERTIIGFFYTAGFAAAVDENGEVLEPRGGVD